MSVITYSLSSEPIKRLSAQDADLKSLFKATGTVHYTQWENPFAFMIYTVLSQQISIVVADVLYARLVERLNGNITPISLLKLSDTSLIEIGLSRAKTVYSKSVAKAALNGTFTKALQPTTPMQEAKRSLMSIRGIGPWSADMFMMFVAGHEDIFALGDLALRQALADIKGIDANDVDELEAITKSYAPYRSIVAHALWQHREG